MSKPLTRKQIRRDVLHLLKNNGHKTYRPKELAKQLGYKDNNAYRLFRDVLTEMDEQRLIAQVKGGNYTFKPRDSRVEGVLSVTAKGFGFVIIEGRDNDVFIGPRNMKNALDGDKVRIGLAAPGRGEKRQEGEVLEVVERRRTQAVGTFKKQGHFAFVLPDDHRLTRDIYVAREAFNEARDGDKVVVSIDRFEDPKSAPEGQVLQVLGRADDPRTQVLALALSLDVRSGFSAEVIKEAEAISTMIPPDEIARRLDLRDRAIFTIDPDDAKDFDDALHFEKLANGSYEVGVHIADVSAYVHPDTAIDAEAFARGTSVYLVDRVVPMLPERLSNEVCSLRPNEDKLTFSCIMEISARGVVKGYQIKETVIHSVQRFTYEEAQALIEGAGGHALAPVLQQANSLAQTLTRKRMREGSVDFDLPEVKVLLDAEGHPTEIVKKVRKDANRLIEEYMLLANRTISEHIGKARKAKPFVYRVHDRPDEEKIRQLAQYVRAFGYKLEISEGSVAAQQLNALFQHVKGTPEEPVIEEAALRAMAKAKYSTDNLGHYGLSFRHYSHFTSPIRRYPDLIAHRLLKRYATGQGPASKADLQTQCDHCSERERAAVVAERESVKLKKVEYIRQHVGDRFGGVVSGITKFGVFIELNDILVEGMVPVRDMDDDYYEYDESTYRLVGTYTGKTYRLGDAVEVVVAAANVEKREVDFVFAD